VEVEGEPLPRLKLVGCRDRFAADDLAGARVCYESEADALDEDDRIARAKVVRTIDRLQAVDASRANTGADVEQIARYALDGRAELLATATVYGGYLGGLSALWLGTLGVSVGETLNIQLPPNSGSWLGPPLLSGLLLSPVVGAGLALGGTGVATWANPSIHAGQTNLVRASMWLASFDQLMLPFLLTKVPNELIWSIPSQHHGLAFTSMLLGINTLVIGGAIGTAALLPETLLPASAGSLALSSASYTIVLSALTQLALDMPLPFEDGTLATAALANAAFVSAIAVAPWLPLGRQEIWLMDGGAIVGGLLGTALVVGFNAPNPRIAYGSIGLGFMLGAGAALGVGKLVPIGLDALPLPDLVALQPTILPTFDGELAPGFVVSVDTSRLGL
jgi:hypothetical protein